MSGPAVTDQPIRVVYGDPTAEELAALVAVLAARASGAAPDQPPRSSAWAAPSRLMRRPQRPGRDNWRLSALPR